MYRRAFLPTFVASLLLALTGCSDQLTGPNQSASGPQASMHPGNAGGPGGPATPAASCDVTVPDDQPSVQAGVDAAASGDQVCVKPKTGGGSYVEQVVINKDLTLKGIDDPTIQGASNPGEFTIPESGPTWEPIVFAFGGTESGGDVSGTGTIDVSISGFVIDGQDQQPNARRAVGIFLRNVQSSKGVTDNEVKNMAVGGKETFGILAYGDTKATIAHNTISGYERGGIGANGDGGAHPSPEIKITNNTLTGSGDGTETAWAPNGIQVGFGATGSIRNNSVSTSRWANFSSQKEIEERERKDWQASCVLVFESNGVKVQNNTIEKCDVGVGVGSWALLLPSADNTKIIKNQFEDVGVGVLLEAVTFSTDWGSSIADASVTNSKVTNNQFTGGSLGEVGIALSTIDGIAQYDPILENSKIIHNRFDGFDKSIVDEGAASKIAANDPAYTP